MIDTESQSPEESAQQILTYLEERAAHPGRRRGLAPLMHAQPEPFTRTYRVAMALCAPIASWWGRMSVEGLEALPRSGPVLLAGNHDSQHGPGRRGRGRAQAPPGPRARQGEPLGRPRPRPDPERDGPDPDPARRGRHRRARSRDRGAARRGLHRRLPGGHALARAHDARPRRNRPPRRGRPRDEDRLRLRHRDRRLREVPEATAGERSLLPPGGRRLPARRGSTASSPPAARPRSAPASRTAAVAGPGPSNNSRPAAAGQAQRPSIAWAILRARSSLPRWR